MNTRDVAIAAACLLIVGGTFILTRPQASNQQAVPLQHYSNATYELSFSYPNAYVLSEMDVPEGTSRAHHVITLMRKEDLPLPENTDGPPVITINLYQNNLDNKTIEGWIANTRESNFKLGESILASTAVSGLPALSYRWSGLYEGTTIVLAQPNWVYVFSVTYPEIGAPIVQDFVKIRDSVQIGTAQ